MWDLRRNFRILVSGVGLKVWFRDFTRNFRIQVSGEGLKFWRRDLRRAHRLLLVYIGKPKQSTMSDRHSTINKPWFLFKKCSSQPPHPKPVTSAFYKGCMAYIRQCRSYGGTVQVG